MHRRSGAGEVIDLLAVDVHRLTNVVAHELEAAMLQELVEIPPGASEQVINADDLVAILDEPLAEVRPEKARTAGYEDPLRHEVCILLHGGDREVSTNRKVVYGRARTSKAPLPMRRPVESGSKCESTPCMLMDSPA